MDDFENTEEYKKTMHYAFNNLTNAWVNLKQAVVEEVKTLIKRGRVNNGK